MKPPTRNEIEANMQANREELRANLEELEGRFRSAVNWRQQVRRNPWLGLALAAGGGFLLASITARPRRWPSSASPGVAAPRHSHLSEAWDNMRSTLIGIAATRATDYLTTLLTRENDASENRSSRVRS